METCKYALGEWKFECNDGEGIYKFDGAFQASVKDRTWSWGCRKVIDSFDDKCYWTEYLNSLDQYLNGNCPDQHVLRGVGSYHDTYAKDRRWKILCCKVNNILHYCKPGKINDHNNQEKIEFETEDETSIVTGLESHHDNSKEYDN